jgi:hypothetical protein
MLQVAVAHKSPVLPMFEPASMKFPPNKEMN